MQPISPRNPLRRLFAGYVENVFLTELGFGEVDVLDYLSEMLARFIHFDSIHSLRNERGARMEGVAEMLASLSHTEESPVQWQQIVHRHIGDVALFWTGVYPEQLMQVHLANSAEFLVDYYQQGKRSYAIASELSTPDARPPGDVLRRLSDDFELCAHGLQKVRRAWEVTGSSGGGSDQLIN